MRRCFECHAAAESINMVEHEKGCRGWAAWDALDDLSLRKDPLGLLAEHLASTLEAFLFVEEEV